MSTCYRLDLETLGYWLNMSKTLPGHWSCCMTCNILCSWGVSSKYGIVCVFDKFHLTFNFRFKVSRDVFKNNNECQLTSKFSSKISPQCHMPSNTCHFNFKICQPMCDNLLQKSHYMSNSKLCVSIDIHSFLGAGFCMSNVKSLQKLCQKYALVRGINLHEWQGLQTGKGLVGYKYGTPPCLPLILT